MQQAQLNHLYGFVQRLNAPRIAVAFSGGGDSTALLHALRDYPSVTHAFIIDHNLRAGSAAETARSGDFARSLGYSVETVRWDHGGVTTGVQVKAREFRYAAMGTLCRENNIAHLLTAHTQDDQAETLLMRQARVTGWRGLAGMEVSAYAPLWPALADVNLHRPLLGVSRHDLRAYNTAHSLSWIDDPSNENEDFARVRARTDLRIKSDLTTKLLELQAQNRARLTAERALFGTWLSRNATVHSQGFVTTTRVPPSELLLHLLRAVSGTGGPIDAARRDALCENMAQNDFNAATLAGAWVIKTQSGYLFTRDIVAVKGRAGEAEPDLNTPATVAVETPTIWDGRWRLQGNVPNIEVQSAFGNLQKLVQETEINDIFDLPQQVRPTLPIYKCGRSYLGFGPHGTDDLRVDNLVETRLIRKFGKIHP